MAAVLQTFSGWGRAVLDFLYPPVCMLCFQRLMHEEESICFECEAALSLRPSWRCPRCGAAGLGAEPEPGRPCRLCPPKGSAYHGVLSVTGYTDRSARCVHLFKYNRRRELGEVMARLMRTHLDGPVGHLGGRLDLIIPVPLHPLRRLTRGFNQSELLARELAAGREIHFETKMLRRVRYTRRQALIPRDRRAENVANAFRVSGRGEPQVRDKGILLVDDVVTTGHTINECARVLKEAGAREVWVACFARAGLGRSGDEE